MGTVKIIIVFSLTLLLSIPGAALSTTVRMQTSLGLIDIDLFDAAAPRTVANFLEYVNRGDYDNSFFHRSIPDFVVQGGGFSWSSITNQYSPVPTEAPVINEFSLDRSNLRGTIAMAKLGDDPNSATSQWFFNLGDNSDNLDNQNGGFTVFGRVKESGLEIIDAIGELQVANAGGAFNDLPLVSFPPQGQSLRTENLVMVNSVVVLPVAPVVPNAPALSYEVDGLNITISWSEVSGATGYKLHYAPSPYAGPEDFNILDVAGQTSASYDLWDGAAYSVAVTAYNEQGDSPYSNIEHFTTELLPPEAPVLTYEMTGNILSLSWSSVTYADTYSLSYAPSPYEGVETINTINMGQSTSAQYSLPSGTSFFIAVQAYNNKGLSPYSNIVEVSAGN